MLKEIKGIFMLRVFLFALFIVHVGQVFADEVVLQNGDRLTGKVVSMKGGTVTLKTEYSEPIKIRSTKIKRISTDDPVFEPGAGSLSRV